LLIIQDCISTDTKVDKWLAQVNESDLELLELINKKLESYSGLYWYSLSLNALIQDVIKLGNSGWKKRINWIDTLDLCLAYRLISTAYQQQKKNTPFVVL